MEEVCTGDRFNFITANNGTDKTRLLRLEQFRSTVKMA